MFNDDDDDDDGIDKEQRRLLGLARQAARLKNAVLIAMLTGKKVSLRRHV
jgi:methyl coenzyme M reductase subunit D